MRLTQAAEQRLQTILSDAEGRTGLRFFLRGFG